MFRNLFTVSCPRQVTPYWLDISMAFFDWARSSSHLSIDFFTFLSRLSPQVFSNSLSETELARIVSITSTGQRLHLHRLAVFVKVADQGKLGLPVFVVVLDDVSHLAFFIFSSYAAIFFQFFFSVNQTAGIRSLSLPIPAALTEPVVDWASRALPTVSYPTTQKYDFYFIEISVLSKIFSA